MPIERIAILVDGSNLYHYLRELKLTGLAEFDYTRLGQKWHDCQSAVLFINHLPV